MFRPTSIHISVLVIAVLLIFGNLATAGDFSPVPLDSWQYRQLDWLLLDPPDDAYFQLSTRPYLRNDIVQLIEQTNCAENQAMQWSKERLLAEYSRRYLYESVTDAAVEIRSKTSPYTIATFADTLEPLYRVGVKQQIAISHKSGVSLFIRGRLENEGQLETAFKGRRWKDKLTGQFDYGTVTYRRGGLTLQYGRSFRVWGYGDTDRLLLSDNAPPFDQIAAQLRYKRLILQVWHSRLDDFYARSDSLVGRYFAGHRISLKPSRNLEIGLSETVLYARQSGPEWYYMNPLLPYYWEQYNNRRDDNIYMGVDFIWWPFDRTRLYGELLLDDFQIDFVSEPHQIGFDLGLSRLGFPHTARLRVDLQYTQIRNYVYGQLKRSNIFIHNGVVIGSSLGPDSDRFRYSAAYALTRDITVTLSGSYRRKGEGRITDPQNMLLPKNEPFPSGIVEKTSRNCLRVSYLRGTLLDIDIEAGYFHIDYLNNTFDRLYSPYVTVRVQGGIQTWLKL